MAFKDMFPSKMPKYTNLLRPSTDKARSIDSSEPGEDDPFVRYRQDGDDGSSTVKCRRAIVILTVLLVANIVVMAASMSYYYEMKPIPPRFNVHDNEYETRTLSIRKSYLPNGKLDLDPPTDYTGRPRQVLEDAWEKIQQHNNIRVTPSELGEFVTDDEIIKLADGSGSMVTMSAYHGLHCVRRLHKNLYHATYYPNLTDTETTILRLHSDHCIDYLRQYIQCNADTTLIPMRWTDESSKPATKDNGNHQCVVWERIEAWMAERSFDPLTPGLLVHPKYGSPFASTPGDRHLSLGLAPAISQGGVHGEQDGHSD